MPFRLRPHYLMALFLLQLWGCANTANEEPIYISPRTNTALQSYFDKVGTVGSGAFAVSPDGHYSFYSYCIDSSCGGISLIQDALLHCQKMAGTKCVILATGGGISHPYKVGSPGAAETVPLMKGPEIERRVAGNTLTGTYKDGTSWRAYFNTDHQVHVLDGDRKLQGSWQVTGDRLCLDYPGTQDDWCGAFRISSFSGGQQTLDIYRDGKLWRSMDMPKTEPGNPGNL